MFRRSLVAFVFVSGVAFADPIPKPSEAEAIKRQWGNFVDNGGGTTLTLEGKRLRMMLPSGDRMIFPIRSDTPAFAPYVAETYRGDFIATVTDHRHSPPANATGFASEPLTGSGLVAIFDEKTILSLGRATMQKDGGLQFRSTFRYPTGSSTTAGRGPANQAKNESVTLRLIRKADLLTMEYSFDDGKKWQQFSKYQRATNDEVKIGIYAEHSCDAVTEAVFEGFSVKPSVDEKKP